MDTRAPLAVHPDNAIVWHDGRLYLLDQRYLPAAADFVACDSAAAVAKAIGAMVVRGAPAIGIAAAYGVALAGRAAFERHGHDWRAHLDSDLERLAASRPTAVNLFWAIRRMRSVMESIGEGDPAGDLLAASRAIHAEDRAANYAMGELGAALITRPTSVITHCNAGALATGGYGTALGVIRSASARGLILKVYADETRPWMQGSRLTAWELHQSQIPVVVQTDGAAASLLATGQVDWVIVGSDRIAANGDVANKIGTYGLAILARYHGVRFMVAAPTSTIDLSVASGADIPIEERAAGEVLSCAGHTLAPQGVDARNPVFDVTPAALVDAIVTERGVVMAPDADKLQALMG